MCDVTTPLFRHSRSTLYCDEAGGSLPRYSLSTAMKPRVCLDATLAVALLLALFASPVLSITPPWSPSLQRGTTVDLITYYFNAGHQYKKIVYFLCIVHGLVISVRQLKRILKGLGLRRRTPKTAANLRLVSRLIRVRYVFLK